jgi:hypothetical protein
MLIVRNIGQAPGRDVADMHKDVIGRHKLCAWGRGDRPPRLGFPVVEDPVVQPRAYHCDQEGGDDERDDDGRDPLERSGSRQRAVAVLIP